MKALCVCCGKKVRVYSNAQYSTKYFGCGNYNYCRNVPEILEENGERFVSFRRITNHRLCCVAEQIPNGWLMVGDKKSK